MYYKIKYQHIHCAMLDEHSLSLTFSFIHLRRGRFLSASLNKPSSSLSVSSKHLLSLPYAFLFVFVEGSGHLPHSYFSCKSISKIKDPIPGIAFLKLAA